MSDLGEALAHVLWIGGAPRTGKTTLSRLLAGKYDLKIYNLDWHQVREHRKRLDRARHPTAVAWEAATMDERWVAPTAEGLLERATAVWTEMFDLVVDDLLTFSRSRVIVADGPGAFPWCVAPLLSSPRQALWLVPTPEFRDGVAGRRFGGDHFADTSDPRRAEDSLRARDVFLGERIAASCAELRLRCVRVDGSLDFDDSLALVEEHFRPHLPETYNV